MSCLSSSVSILLLKPILDLLFNHGEDSLQIIMSENISREDIIQNYRNFSELNLDE